MPRSTEARRDDLFPLMVGAGLALLVQRRIAAQRVKARVEATQEADDWVATDKARVFRTPQEERSGLCELLGGKICRPVGRGGAGQIAATEADKFLLTRIP